MPSNVGEQPSQSRIRMLERHEVTPEIGAIYDALLQQRGVVPNMFKVLANIPALAQGIVAFLKPIVGNGALPGWYKELIAVRICLLHKFEYGIRAHSLSAKQKGARDVQIGAPPAPSRRDRRCLLCSTEGRLQRSANHGIDCRRGRLRIFPPLHRCSAHPHHAGSEGTVE
jgi:hypothetical protein